MKIFYQRIYLCCAFLVAAAAIGYTVNYSRHVRLERELYRAENVEDILSVCSRILESGRPKDVDLLERYDSDNTLLSIDFNRRVVLIHDPVDGMIHFNCVEQQQGGFRFDPPQILTHIILHEVNKDFTDFLMKTVDGKSYLYRFRFTDSEIVASGIHDHQEFN